MDEVEDAYQRLLLQPNDPNRERFAGSIRKYLNGVIRKKLRGLPVQEIDDLTQDAVIKVMDGLTHFRGDSKLSTWACEIGINVVRDFFRALKARRQKTDMQIIDEAEHEASRPMEEVIANQEVSRLLSKLKEVIDDLSNNPLAQAVLVAASDHLLGCADDKDDTPSRRQYIDQTLALVDHQQQSARQVIRRRFDAFRRRRGDDAEYTWLYEKLFPDLRNLHPEDVTASKESCNGN